MKCSGLNTRGESEWKQSTLTITTKRALGVDAVLRLAAWIELGGVDTLVDVDASSLGVLHVTGTTHMTTMRTGRVARHARLVARLAITILGLEMITRALLASITRVLLATNTSTRAFSCSITLAIASSIASVVRIARARCALWPVVCVWATHFQLAIAHILKQRASFFRVAFAFFEKPFLQNQFVFFRKTVALAWKV